MGITWSLAIEEQFYLLLPLVMRVLSFRRVTQLEVGSIVLAPILRFSLEHAGNGYFGPYVLLPCRADALGFGLLIAIACRDKEVWAWLETNRRKLYAALAVMSCGVVFLILRQQYFYNIGISVVAAFYAVIVLLVLVKPGKVERYIFQARFLTKLGMVAYAVYMLQQGVNALFHHAVFGEVPRLVGPFRLS